MQQSDQAAVQALRKEIFLTACCGGTGHLASSFSVVEILYTLYGKQILRYRAQEPAWENRDRLILSKGHACLALYNVLCNAGYFSRAALRTYCQPGSVFGGEGNPNEVPGVETATGSLGHGLSYALGVALAAQNDGRDTRVYCIVGDGECEEGTIWEAAMAAARFGLSQLTVILDANRVQKMGTVEAVMGITDWAPIWRAFGWSVDEVDGHDVDALQSALSRAPEPGKPRLLIAHTVKGKGVSIMENNAAWHWKMPTAKELPRVLEALGITEDEWKQCSKPI